jgi:hypothetical protein
MAVLWTALIPGEVEVEQEVAEVEQGRVPVMLPLQVQARVVRAARAAGYLPRAVIIPTRIIAEQAIRAELKEADPARVMGMMERAKTTAGAEESEETRIGVAEMAIPGTGTIPGRGKVRPQVK